MDEIRKWIENGQYAPGTPLPTEAAIGKRLDVGLNAVRQALAELRHEGLISTKQGQPSIVRPSPDRTFRCLEPGDRLVSRMPTLAERRRHQLEPGVPVLERTSQNGHVELLPADSTGINGPAPATRNNRRQG